MPDYEGRWPLSFNVGFIHWDGKILSLIDRDTIRRNLERCRELGLRWIMTGGIQFIEPAAFDMAEGTTMFRELLDEFEMSVSSRGKWPGSVWIGSSRRSSRI